MTPFYQMLSITLKNVQKLLIDYRMGKDINNDPDYDDTPYQNSQFKHLYGNTAYEADGNRRPYKAEIGAPEVAEPFYPLSMSEALDLQDVRILDYVQLGFIPIEDIEDIEAPSLFIANATDRQRVSAGDTTLNQVEEIIPLNFRLVMKQPKIYQIDKTNIVVTDKILEGLKYVLDPDAYINLSFERRGYNAPTVIRMIEFVQSLNLEEFLDPYEVVDYLFRITVREQRSRSK